MDIEQLSKSQIVLLTLLVSFVTSIATGIVTVSLVEQAPPAIAQTVNRVIERTIEKVAPSQAAATAVAQQRTVVVKESDLVAQAVAGASPSVVRVYSTTVTGPTFLGLGIVMDTSGTIATDAAALGEEADGSVALPDGTTVRAFVVARDTTAGIAYLSPATSSKAVVWKAAPLSTKVPILGTSLLTLSGETVARLGNGLAASLTSGKSGTIIDTTIPESAIMKGSPLIDIDGNIVGISTSISRASNATAFLSAGGIKVPAKENTTTQ